MLNSQEELVGLDIGEGAVSATRLKVGAAGRLDISHAGSRVYPPGAPDHEIAKAIRELWRACQLPSEAVCACLRSPSLLVRSFDYPALTDKELEAALRLLAEEELQTSDDQLQMHWQIFNPVRGDGPNTASTRTEGFLVAVPRKEAQRYLGLVEAANLYTVVLDIGCTAIANLYLALRSQTLRDEAVCLVHVSGHFADLAIVHGHTRLYPRTLYLPAQSWVEAWKRLVESINAELLYFQFKLHQPAVQQVMLVGDQSVPAEMAEKMQDRMAVPVQYWEPLKDPRVHLPKTVQGDIQNLSAISLGLALRTA